MNLRVAILILSLVGNIVLASFVLRQRHNPSTTADINAPLHQTLDLNSANSPATTDPSSAAEQLPITAPSEGNASDKFNWSQLEAADYKDYIARLRAFGVTEKVVRDIIIADVNKLFRPRFAALRPPKKPKSPNFWETRRQNYSPDRDMTTAQRGGLFALFFVHLALRVVVSVACLPKIRVRRFLWRTQGGEAWAKQFVHVSDDDVAHNFIRHTKRAKPNDVVLVIGGFEL